jgi:hypothetical protein
LKYARPWFVAVMVLYLAFVIGVLLLVPAPWNVVVAIVITLMALRFYILIRKVSDIGKKPPAPPAPPAN